MSEKTNYDGSTPFPDRREKFAYLLALGDITASDAYRSAGYQAKEQNVWAAASQLFRNVKVKARIAYLKAEWAQEDGITREKQAEKLRKAERRAWLDQDTQTFIRAVESESRHYGLLVDRSIIEQSEEQRQLSRERAQEARRLAEMRLHENRTPDNHDAEPVPAGAGPAPSGTE